MGLFRGLLPGFVNLNALLGFSLGRGLSEEPREIASQRPASRRLARGRPWPRSLPRGRIRGLETAFEEAFEEAFGRSELEAEMGIPLTEN